METENVPEPDDIVDAMKNRVLNSNQNPDISSPKTRTTICTQYTFSDLVEGTTVPVNSRTSTDSRSNEDCYDRKLTVFKDDTYVDFGWIDNPGVVLIKNLERSKTKEEEPPKLLIDDKYILRSERCFIVDMGGYQDSIKISPYRDHVDEDAMPVKVQIIVAPE